MSYSSLGATLWRDVIIAKAKSATPVAAPTTMMVAPRMVMPILVAKTVRPAQPAPSVVSPQPYADSRVPMVIQADVVRDQPQSTVTKSEPGNPIVQATPYVVGALALLLLFSQQKRR